MGSPRDRNDSVQKIVNTTYYRVSVNTSASKIKPFHGADFVSSQEEIDETSNQKALVEEFGNLNSVAKKESVQEAPSL